MNRVELDFSPIFEGADTPEERMFAFGQQLDALTQELSVGGMQVAIPSVEGGEETLLLRRVTVPDRRMNPTFPGVGVTTADGNSLGALANSYHVEPGLFRRQVYKGALNFMPPDPSSDHRHFSITADSLAFKNPKTVELYKPEFARIVRSVGAVLLQQVNS